MSKWPMLNHCLEQGSLSFIDLAFASSVLKKLNSDRDEHAALLSTLFALSRQGHLCLDLEEIHFALQKLSIENCEDFAELVRRGAASFPDQGIADVFDGNERPGTWICRFEDNYYLQKNWVYESEILSHLDRLSKASPAISLSPKTFETRLNTEQKKAVVNGIENALSLLTGGPGTGKTFTAAEIVKTCLSSVPTEHPFRIILTAPTGKAVAQLEGNLRKTLGIETTVRAGTLHSILGIRAYVHEEDEITPLFADLIIVDECSMIDAKIFSRLLASVPSGARLILIGDKDQLPPVEAGSVFADLLDTGIYPATHLSECLRSDRSEILKLSSLVKEGQADAALQFLSENSDIDWIDLDEGKKTASQLCADLWTRCNDRFPSCTLEKPTSEQILSQLGSFSLLSCMRQGPLGVDAINRYFLHQYLKLAATDSWWIAPVMITRNDYELDLFNGDLGFLVRKVSQDFSLRQFHIDDYAVFHDRNGGFRQIAALALTSFEYSYCLSVHKSQGSEYDEALILAPRGSESFGREVLYTAITRARRKVALAGSRELLRQAITISSRKISGLSARVKLTSI